MFRCSLKYLSQFLFWISFVNILVSTQGFKKPSFHSVSNTSFAVRNESTSNETHGSIIFPDHFFSTNFLFVPKITEKCKRLGICEDIPNYPEHHIERLLERRKLFNRTKINVVNEVLKPKFGLKFGPEEDFLELCKSTEKLVAPRAAKDINNKWYFILNREKEPQQKFRVEICAKQSAPCSPVAHFAQGYRGRCIQKYVLRIMTAIDKYGDIIEMPFRVPSCCSCVYRVNSIYL
ncbi:unnamed protein product [Parnassius apollo]|uniref:(apollo) hypothetical protein n=1 Tax=Parnassius apollo TaxID=110799 RepID=A0A8S3XC69_PARAO|nr:unnamed protein product [Parnassius apollo]